MQDFAVATSRTGNAIPSGLIEPAVRIEPASTEIDGYMLNGTAAIIEVLEELLRTNDDAESIRAFTQRYGRLSPPGDHRFEFAKDWRRSRRNLADAMKAAVPGRYKAAVDMFDYNRLGTTTIRFSHAGVGKRLKMRIVPVSLISAMWVAFGVALTGRTEVRTCKNCATVMLVGGSGGGNRKREYCSDARRVAFCRRHGPTAKRNRQLGRRKKA